MKNTIKVLTLDIKIPSQEHKNVQKGKYISSKIYLLNVMFSEKKHLVIDNYFKIAITNNAQRL